MAALGSTKVAMLVLYMDVLMTTSQYSAWQRSSIVPLFRMDGRSRRARPRALVRSSTHSRGPMRTNINIFFDLFILLLPIPQLSTLNIEHEKKTYLILIFSVRLFIMIASIVRLPALVEFATTTNATHIPVAYWSVLEAFVSIICCCLPAVRSILRRLFPGCFGSTNENTGSATSYRMSRGTPVGKCQIQKNVNHTVSIIPRSGDSDIIGLMDKRHGIQRYSSRIPTYLCIII